jgi:hypothetical protein
VNETTSTPHDQQTRHVAQEQSRTPAPNVSLPLFSSHRPFALCVSLARAATENLSPSPSYIPVTSSDLASLLDLFEDACLLQLKVISTDQLIIKQLPKLEEARAARRAGRRCDGVLRAAAGGR